MVLTKPFGLSLAMATLLAAAAPAQAPLIIKDKLPADTLLYMAAPDIAQSIQDFKTQALYKLWAEEEVQDFLKQPLAMLEMFTQKGKEELVKNLKAQGLPITADEVIAIRPGGAQVALIGPGGPGEMIRFALVLQLAEGIATADKMADFGLGILKSQMEMMKQFPDAAPPFKLLELNGGKTLVADTTQTGGPFNSLTVWYKSGTLMLTSSHALAQQLLGPAKEDCLSKSADFVKCFSQLRCKGAELESFVRPAGLIQMVKGFLPMIPDPGFQGFMQENHEKIDKGLAASGLTSLKAVGFTSTYLDGKSAWDSFMLAPAPRKGFLKLLDGPPVNREHIAWVPKDVASFSYSTLPINKLVDTILDIVTAADPQIGQMVAGQLANFKEEIGVDIQADFLAQFEGEFIFYQKNSSNLSSLPPMVGIVKIKEQQKILNSLETLLGLSQGMATLEKIKDPATGLETYSLELDDSALSMGDLPINPLSLFQPTFAFNNGYMVMGISGRDVIKAIEKMNGKGKSIHENGEFQAFMASLPETASSISFSNFRDTISTLYQSGTTAVQLMNLDEDLPVDLAMLPGTDTVIKHFFAQTSFGVTTPDGYLAKSTGPLGPELIIAGVAVGAAAAVFTSRQDSLPIAIGGGMGGRKPSVEAKPLIVKKGGEEKAGDKPTQTQLLKVQEDFDNLRSGLMIYNVETGSYPVNLSVLLKPTKDYPNGFLSENPTQLPKDPWGNNYQYLKSSKGYRIWSVGPNGKSEDGKGDDILSR